MLVFRKEPACCRVAFCRALHSAGAHPVEPPELPAPSSRRGHQGAEDSNAAAWVPRAPQSPRTPDVHSILATAAVFFCLHSCFTLCCRLPLVWGTGACNCFLPFLITSPVF